MFIFSLKWSRGFGAGRLKELCIPELNDGDEDLSSAPTNDGAEDSEPCRDGKEN